MESPDDPNRCRYLKGTDPNRKELLEKIQKLEALLAEKEVLSCHIFNNICNNQNQTTLTITNPKEKLLEKDLILEEVVTLTNRLKKQAVQGRQESNQVTVKLNDLTKKIKNVTRSMMAKVSELSMHQALAMNLFQEKAEKEALVESISSRMSRGDLPVEIIERDLIRAEKQRQWAEQQLAEAREKAARGDPSKFVQVYVLL